MTALWKEYALDLRDCLNSALETLEFALAFARVTGTHRTHLVRRIEGLKGQIVALKIRNTEWLTQTTPATKSSSSTTSALPMSG